jgi:hypothetical protein
MATRIVPAIDGCSRVDPVSGSTAVRDSLQVLATVGFPALQFNAVKKQFVATCKVPLPVSREGPDRPFAGAN